MSFYVNFPSNFHRLATCCASASYAMRRGHEFLKFIDGGNSLIISRIRKQPLRGGFVILLNPPNFQKMYIACCQWDTILRRVGDSFLADFGTTFWHHFRLRWHGCNTLVVSAIAYAQGSPCLLRDNNLAPLFGTTRPIFGTKNRIKPIRRSRDSRRKNNEKRRHPHRKIRRKS